MKTTAPYYLLIVRNGPVWDLEKTLGFFARTLGTAFEGEICTFGEETGHLPRGDGGMEVRRYVWRNPSNPFARLWYTMRVVGRAWRARWLQRRKLVMVAYDPFQSGLVGALVKWTTGATFVCEVNGVYGDDDNLIDIADVEQRRKKKESMLRTGSFVLRQADFIKILFPEQLRGFDPDAIDKPQTWFFDLIDAEFFEPAGLEPEKRITFLGYPFYRKGIDVLLKAWARTRDAFPEWELSLIGFGLEPIAHELGLPVDGVDFAGPQPPDVVVPRLEASAGLILPSRSEGMGRVLLEAALLNRPRLGSRVGGIPYYIEDDVDGLLFEPEDVDSLEAVLMRFMGDPDLRERLGNAARARAVRWFSGEEYVRRYAEVFEQLTGMKATLPAPTPEALTADQP